MNAIPIENVIYLHSTVAGDDNGPCADMDKNMIHISWAQGNGYMHNVIGDITTQETETIIAGDTAHTICFWPNEAEMIASFWGTMNNVAEFPDTTILGGWAIRHLLWPLLITKGMHYGIKINPMFKSDPMSRFCTTTCLLDLSEIYMQGAYPGWRRYPALPDFLAYMGVPQTDNVPYHVTDAEFIEYTMEDWKTRGYKQVAAYLYGMQCVARSYYA